MKFFLTSILLGISLLPASVLAQNFLVGIPGIGSPTGNFDGYINAIYAMFISIAALLAVVKIVIAGVKYMFSDIVTQKSEAKKDIQGAIFGLILILGAVLILTVINPDLTNFNLEQNQIALPDPLDDPTLTRSDALTIQEFCAANDGACTSSPCRRLGTDYLITAIVNTPINAASCRLFCSGVVVGGSCLYVTGDVPVNLPPLTGVTIIPCIQDGETVDCRSSRNTCINGYGGTAEGIDTNGVLQISCTPPPNREVFPCNSLGRQDFDCRSAEARCTGGRTATQNDSGELVCETN